MHWRYASVIYIINKHFKIIKEPVKKVWKIPHFGGGGAGPGHFPHLKNSFTFVSGTTISLPRGLPSLPPLLLLLLGFSGRIHRSQNHAWTEGTKFERIIVIKLSLPGFISRLRLGFFILAGS